MVGRSRPLSGSGGFETALWLFDHESPDGMERTQLGDSVSKGLSLGMVRRYSATRGQPAAAKRKSRMPRSLGHQSKQVDDAVLQMLVERIGSRTEAAQAVVIPHASLAGN